MMEHSTNGLKDENGSLHATSAQHRFTRLVKRSDVRVSRAAHTPPQQPDLQTDTGWATTRQPDIQTDNAHLLPVTGRGAPLGAGIAGADVTGVGVSAMGVGVG